MTRPYVFETGLTVWVSIVSSTVAWSVLIVFKSMTLFFFSHESSSNVLDGRNLTTHGWSLPVGIIELVSATTYINILRVTQT